ncbi:MAG: TerB family tellurite resistance protein [Melioribacteraceae bacterium]|nr:TerB family tellurite resistance protein [Melioribacteraceae bacterium]
MLGFIKSLISNNDLSNDSEVSNKYNSETKLQIATCALFLEIANSDDDFSIEEKIFIEKTMREEFNLDDELVTELLALAEEQTDESISLYEFTEVINKQYGRDAKLIILKNLWRLVFADGTLDKYEEYFMRTISKNLHLEHSDMIAAKLEAKGEK